VALDLSYEAYVELNGGEHCGICGRPPAPARRHDRDHDHATGLPRGLLCPVCNQRLARRVTEDWLAAAVAYLKRARDRGGILPASEPSQRSSHEI
jgi:hypothetical protein